MPEFDTTPGFAHGQPTRTGLLLVNLGTPTEPTTAAVRRFLAEFLWDPRVVEYPRLPWWLILNLVILRIRPRRSAAAYASIWTEQGSPLMHHSRELATALDTALPDVEVELAMTYGEPSTGSAIDRLLERGVRRILVLPLYPQYSGTTTAAVFDAVARKYARLRWLPELRFIANYHDDVAYIAALAASVEAHHAAHGRGDHLLMSFHGVPQRTLENGDPYHCHCQKTARLLAAALNLDDDAWSLSFQSRVGREAWLAPYTDERVRELGAAGVRSLDVICPGFATDCLETLEEIAMQNAGFFTGAGGGELRYVPSLNASAGHVAALAAVTERHLAGWRDDPADAAAATRAIAMGAEA